VEDGARWKMVPGGRWCPVEDGARWKMVPGF